MITCVVYDANQKELQVLRKILHQEAGYASEDEWLMHFFGNRAELEAYFTRQDNVDIICLDIMSQEMLAKLERIRMAYRNVKLMLIADTRISPMVYLRPAVHPDALLLRPFNEEKMQRVFRELIGVYMREVYGAEVEGSYTVVTRQGRVILPYDKILYFEAREKKIFVRSGRQEYGFYDTMDHLAEKLPKEFVRCHRSFILNKKRIKKVLLSQDRIELDNQELIPVSRTYKTEVRKL